VFLTCLCCEHFSLAGHFALLIEHFQAGGFSEEINHFNSQEGQTDGNTCICCSWSVFEMACSLHMGETALDWD
jgi:hypothetical protein